MVKRFLNGMERDDLSVLVAFQKYMDKKVERLIILKRPKNQIRFSKMVRTYAKKLIHEIIAPLDATVRQKTATEADKTMVITRYHDEAVREYKEMLELDSVTPVKTKDFSLLIEALKNAYCDVCEEPGANTHLCEIKPIFLAHGIEVYDEYAPEGICPYQVKAVASPFGVALSKAIREKGK